MTELKTFSDGGARGNPGPAAIALLIFDENDKLLASHSEFIGNATNNVAEYRAVLKALKMAKKFKPTKVMCYLDSLVVASQLAGIYRIKKLHLLELYKQAKEEEKSVGHVRYKQVSRENKKIALADGMLNAMLDKLRRGGR